MALIKKTVPTSQGGSFFAWEGWLAHRAIKPSFFIFSVIAVKGSYWPSLLGSRLGKTESRAPPSATAVKFFALPFLPPS